MTTHSTLPTNRVPGLFTLMDAPSRHLLHAHHLPARLPSVGAMRAEFRWNSPTISASSVVLGGGRKLWANVPARPVEEAF
mmetsp:Transcript_44112/g.68973  ORF Transcript_44112/g.68973 Transcript_44112/m.68973 type:complete len:80 (+) Transcript_44112:866-1105(+)